MIMYFNRKQSHLEYFWYPKEHTFITKNGNLIILVYCPIEEGDITGELIVGVKPSFGRDPQPAGDLVEFPLPQGSSVLRHTSGDDLIVNRPGQSDMVWVESFGHTN